MTPRKLIVLASFASLCQARFPTATVTIGDHGPYEFLVDMGNQATFIEPRLAEELGLRPDYRVEVVNVGGSHLAPATTISDMRIDGAMIPTVEVLMDDPVQVRKLFPGIRGVLGGNALRSVNYSLTSRDIGFRITDERPLRGEALPFLDLEGNIIVSAKMGSEEVKLKLDSGANHMVLFRVLNAMAKNPAINTTITTLTGARRTVADIWTDYLFFGNRLRLNPKSASIVGSIDSRIDGLLPTTLFRQVFIDWMRHEVVLVP